MKSCTNGSSEMIGVFVGIIVAILSFCRTVVFLVVPVFVLPVFFELGGVWAAIPVGEVLALIMSVYYFTHLRYKVAV